MLLRTLNCTFSVQQQKVPLLAELEAVSLSQGQGELGRVEDQKEKTSEREGAKAFHCSSSNAWSDLGGEDERAFSETKQDCSGPKQAPSGGLHEILLTVLNVLVLFSSDFLGND